MKLPRSFSRRQALMLVILVAVAGLMLARHLSNRVPVQPSLVSEPAATKTSAHTTSGSSRLTSEANTSTASTAAAGAPLTGAQSGNGVSTLTERQGTQATTASSPSSHANSQTQLVTEGADTKQQVEEPSGYSASNEPERG